MLLLLFFVVYHSCKRKRVAVASLSRLDGEVANVTVAMYEGRNGKPKTSVTLLAWYDGSRKFYDSNGLVPQRQDTGDNGNRICYHFVRALNMGHISWFKQDILLQHHGTFKTETQSASQEAKRLMQVQP